MLRSAEAIEHDAKLNRRLFVFLCGFICLQQIVLTVCASVIIKQNSAITNEATKIFDRLQVSPTDVLSELKGLSTSVKNRLEIIETKLDIRGEWMQEASARINIEVPDEPRPVHQTP